MVSSLIFSLGCLTVGCDSKSGTETAPEDVPAGIKVMKENIKGQIQQMKGQMKGAKGKRQAG
jgi:hypothetical protein